MVEILQKFVAFSEYMNLKKLSQWDSLRGHKHIRFQIEVRIQSGPFFEILGPFQKI